MFIFFFFFFFNDPATPEIYTLSLHDALPILGGRHSSRRSDQARSGILRDSSRAATSSELRSEEHTSELQSHVNLVCRLLLEKKKKKKKYTLREPRSGIGMTCTIVNRCALRCA